MNQGRILHAADDQFEAFYTSDVGYGGSFGFNFILTRKKPGGSSTQYQYKIGGNASLNAGNKEYIDKLQPKPAGEWIDVTYNGKDLYLYLECQLSVSERDLASNRPARYIFSSARLITTDSSLPKNFSGTYVKKLDSYGFNYYETILVRKFLGILIFTRRPVIFCAAAGLLLTNYYMNGIAKTRI